MIKHLKFHTLLIVFIWALTAGCSEQIEEQRDTAPWEDVTFLGKATTYFTLVNTGADSISYRYDMDRNQPSQKHYSGKLGQGDSIRVKHSLFRPIRSFLGINGTSMTGPYLLPTLSRRISWDGDSYKDTGTNSIYYGYLKTLDDAFPSVGDASLLELPLDEVQQHQKGLTQEALKQGEAYAASNSVSKWLKDFYQREAALKGAAALESQRGYLDYAYKKTLSLSPQVHHWIDSLLDDPNNLTMPTRDKLRQSHSYNEAAPPVPGMTLGNRNNRLDFEDIADSFPTDDADLYHDFLAEWTENQLLDYSTYANKDELIARAREILPADYVQQLDYIRDSINARISSDGAALKLLALPFASTSDTLTPLLHRTKPYTLYKFWFPGCRPCVSQYPFERELLAEYPNLELVNVAYETRKDHWREYIQKNEMPGSQQLYLPKQKREAVRAALGMLGAPRYLMLGPGNKLACRNCPKPNDALLAKLIK